MITYIVMHSPFGDLAVADSPSGLYQIDLLRGHSEIDVMDSGHESQTWILGASLQSGADRQLAEYFAGKRRSFDLVLAQRGSDFQRRVWQALTKIPYGRTASYAEIAGRIGKPGAARAVGAANGRNPSPIVGPCHRVIGSDGSLTGYAGGLAWKRALLDWEARGAAENPIDRVGAELRPTMMYGRPRL
jgi:methylated-DNA-[protein]-cysteine S-methyltransferase